MKFIVQENTFETIKVYEFQDQQNCACTVTMFENLHDKYVLAQNCLFLDPELLKKLLQAGILNLRKSSVSQCILIH